MTGRDLYLGFNSREPFTAVASLDDGTTRDVTAMATWQSSDSSVATIDRSAPGYVTAVDYGATTISARFEGVTGSRATKVLCGVYLLVSPSSLPPLSVGTSVTLTTHAEFVQPMFEEVSATWSSSRPDMATVANIPSLRFNQVVVTAVSAGQATLHATYGCDAEDVLVTVAGSE